MILRPYTPDDWPAVCRIHDAARVQELAAGNVDPRAFRLMVVAAGDDEFFVSTTVVACHDGDDGVGVAEGVDRTSAAVAGFVSWNGSYITWLYVDPAVQRRGIGRQLLDHALRQIGPHAWTNMIGGNNAALRLYLAAGLDVVWSRPGDCDGYPCTAMRLALPTSRMHDPDAKRESK